MTWDREFERAFQPRTVAVVGASSKPERVSDPWGGGTVFISNLKEMGFPGRVYPIHPRASEIMGLPAYPSLTAVPEPLDLVIVSVPAARLEAVLEDCIAAGARNVHLFTAGFEEIGEEEGRVLGQRVRETALRGGLRLLGPNCMGLYVPSSRIGPFSGLSTETGPVAFISQSGGHANWLSHYGPDYGFYFSKVISFGNAYVLDSTDFLEYLADDEATRLVCMYLEGVKDGRKLIRLVRQLNGEKPVVIWKGGLTESGSRAVASHTASLAGNERVWAAFFQQTGAVPVNGLEEMAEAAMSLLLIKGEVGHRVAVIGAGGGISVAAADVCHREGLSVPPLSTESRRKLNEFVPTAGFSVRNPLDAGTAMRNVEELRRTIEIVAADPAIDAVVLMLALDQARLAGVGRIEELVCDLYNSQAGLPGGKALLVTFDSNGNKAESDALQRRWRVEFPRRGVPAYRSLERASRALARVVRHREFQAAQHDQ